MPILSELRRRKVYQSVGIYLAAAWAILQVGGFVTELWDSPPWVLRALFLLLLAGIPVVFTVSWLFDFSHGSLVATDPPPPRGRLRLAAASTLVLFGVLLLAAYLWPDERPSADVRRLRLTTTTIDGDAHAYDYGLFGFNAPRGSDFWQHGRFRVNTYNGLGIELPNPPDALRFTVDRDDLCRLREAGCWPRFQSEAVGIERLLEANADLLERYRALSDARSFANVIHVDWQSPLPEFQNLFIAQSLLGRELVRGEPGAAGAALAEQIGFHRLILAESQNVIGKMVAAALLEEDLRLYAELGGPGPAPARLSPAEMSFVAPFRWEAMSLVNGLDVDRETIAAAQMTEPLDRALFRVVPYLPNRTVNAMVAPILRAAEASLLSPAELAARRDEFAPQEPDTGEWLTNTAGAFMWRGVPDFLSYVERIHDLDALIVLAQVVHAAHAEGVDASTVSAFLLALPAELRDPADGRPPAWADGVLAFEGRAEARIVPRLSLALPTTR